MVTPEVSGVMVSSEASATFLMFLDVILISDLCAKLWLEEEKDIVTTSAFLLCVESFMCGLSIN